MKLICNSIEEIIDEHKILANENTD